MFYIKPEFLPLFWYWTSNVIDELNVGGYNLINLKCSKDGCSCQCSGSFVSDWRAAGVEEVVDAADEARSLRRVGEAHLVDQLNDHQLQNVAEILDLEHKNGIHFGTTFKINYDTLKDIN